MPVVTCFCLFVQFVLSSYVFYFMIQEVDPISTAEPLLSSCQRTPTVT